MLWHVLTQDQYVHWRNDTAVARQWLSGTSEDFKCTCYLAGVNPEWVLRPPGRGEGAGGFIFGDSAGQEMTDINVNEMFDGSS